MRLANSIPGALILAAFAGVTAAQVPVVQPTQPPLQVPSAIRGITVQRAAPAMACAKADIIECAETDEQRRMLLMSYAAAKFTDEQLLRLIAGLQTVNLPNEIAPQTPLTAMVGAGRLKAVNALLARGADPRRRDNQGVLLLERTIEAAFAGAQRVRPEVLESLRAVLRHSPVALDATLAMRGPQNLDLDLLALMLEHGANPLAKGRYGYTPLDLASSWGRADVVRMMVGAKVRVPAAELDARAYHALAERKPELVEALRAGGADPVRHVRATPGILFDALRPERSAEVVEMVLAAGADPNAPKSPQVRTPPLFEARFHPEKTRLLIKHGADVNAKDQSGYTLLAQALYTPRLENKPAVVRMLLDAGVNVNGDHGGWGRDGALGLARREEPDMIALLVERGATLAGKDSRGPLTIAVQMERDDLALALLRRDRKVGPNDSAALPLAARRGWRPVVVALLQAGADANAADDQGMTALALAERRRDAEMSKALVGAGAKPVAQPQRAALPAGADFPTVAAREIDEVVFFDPPRFALTDGKQGPFAFYGQGRNQFEQVSCERSAAFGIIANANMAGGINAGLCTAEAKRVRDLAAASKPALEGLLGQLSQGGGFKADSAQLAKLGWKYEKSAGADGAEEHYFALIAVGHGLASVPTLVRVPKGARRAIVVQASTMQLCDGFGLQDQTPLCSDTRKALSDIARRLETRFPK